MYYVKLKGGPYGGAEGELPINFLHSWISVTEGGAGENGLIVSPGSRAGRELYVLSAEGDVSVYQHWTVGAGISPAWEEWASERA